jgi:hypothetical protein
MITVPMALAPAGCYSGRMTNWFAHSLPGRLEHEWEELAVHLREVERRAAAHAGKFGAAELGGIAGRLHDLGKYNSDFLVYIRGQGKSPDHTSAGANYARTRLGLSRRAAGLCQPDPRAAQRL